MFIPESHSLIKSPDDSIRVTSWNVNSLGDKNKRKKIHSNINKSLANLIVLQDTHTSLETEYDHKKCTKHRVFFNHLKSNARGVTILVKDSCPITDIKSTIIFPGNLTQLNFTFKGERFSLGALYAPNEKDINFFKTLFKTQIDTDIKHTLYLGDWNTSLSQ